MSQFEIKKRAPRISDKAFIALAAAALCWLVVGYFLRTRVARFGFGTPPWPVWDLSRDSNPLGYWAVVMLGAAIGLAATYHFVAELISN